jgi:hypothetical protein
MERSSPNVLLLYRRRIKKDEIRRGQVPFTSSGRMWFGAHVGNLLGLSI